MKTKSKKKTSKRSKTKVKSTKHKTKRTIDRIEASVIHLSSLKGKVTVDRAIAGCNDVYVRSGGESNLKEAKFSFKRVAKVLALLKMLKMEDGQIQRMK